MEDATNHLSECYILYGSETGTARNYSRTLWQKLRDYNVNCFISSLDQFEMDLFFEKKMYIFIVSTTGQGYPPKNMERFWKFILRKNHPIGHYLNDMRYSVLGLGDSNYTKYNYCGLILSKRLKQLGAIPLLDLGLADDQDPTGPDYQAIPWLKKCLQCVLAAFSIPFKEDISLSLNNYIPRFHINSISHNIENCINVEFYEEDSNNFELLENVRLTSSDHFQQVNKLTFGCQTELIRVKNINPGDIAIIRPKNSIEDVEKLSQLLNFSDEYLQTLVSIVMRDPLYDEKPEFLYNDKLNNAFTVGYLLENYFDLVGVPKQNVFFILHFIATDVRERDRLLEIASDYDDYLDYCYRPKKTFIDVCTDFYSTTKEIKFEHLFDLLSPIVSRSYSISSKKDESITLDKSIYYTKFSIIVAKVQYKTVMSTPRVGLCSRYLCDDVTVGANIHVSIRPGILKFYSFNTPKILIGPGTGCAPFAFYVDELLSYSSNSNVKLKKSNIIFLGFRNYKKDYLLKETFTNAVEKGVCETCVAFSRDQPHKIYVQDIMKENSILIYETIKELNAAIIVCGNAKNSMPKCVKDAFIEILVQNSTIPIDKGYACELIKKMEKLGLYQEEIW